MTKHVKIIGGILCLYGLWSAGVWAEQSPEPIDDNGVLRYVHGTGTPAEIVCTPLNLCMLELEAGEQVLADGVHIGDAHRWVVNAVLGGTKPFFLIKPTRENLQTTLTIITLSRTYTISLVSTDDESRRMAHVGWLYPQRSGSTMIPIPNTQRQPPGIRPSSLAEDPVMPNTGIAIRDLDFNYDIDGCKNCSFKPVRVFSDGQQTFIELPEAALNSELPALLVLTEQGDALVNYRLLGNRFVVDAVFDEALLHLGTGRNRSEVKIKRK